MAVDMTVTFLSSHRRFELKSGPRRKQFSSLRTAHFAPVLRRFPLLHGGRAGIPGIGIYIFIPGIEVSGYRVAMASTQKLEMLRCQLDEFTAQMVEIRQQSSSIAINAAVTRLTEAVRTKGQSVSKTAPRGHESREARAVRTGQRL